MNKYTDTNKNVAYFDHEADIGIIGRGKTIEAAFIAAAKAMFAIMTDLQAIQPTQTIMIEFDEQDLEFALITWLNLLLSKAREHNLVFSQFDLHKNDSHWRGSASGEKWNEQHIRGTEVKGATLTMLSVRKKTHLWEACCIVDV